MAKRDEVTKGLLIQTPNGPRKNPLVAIAAGAVADMIKFASHFGMSAAARARIASGTTGQPGRSGKFAGLLNEDR